MSTTAIAIATAPNHVSSVEELEIALVSIEVDSAFGVARHGSPADVSALDAVAFECEINEALSSLFTRTFVAHTGEWALDAASIAFLEK